MSIIGTLSALLASSFLALSPAAATQERLGYGAETGDSAPSTPPAGSQATPEQTAADEDAGEVVPGEILVKFKEGLSEEEIDRIHRRLGAKVVDTMLGGRLMLVTIPYENATSQLVDAYAATEGVEYAEPNQKVSLFPPPEDDPVTPPSEGQGSGSGLPPPNEDGSAPLIPLPGPK